jgi:hypothetical protein
MNERIRELAEQNRFIHSWMPPGEQYELLQRYEKFAKLLIKDVLSELEYERGYYANPQGYQEEEYYIRCEGKVSVLEDVIDTLKSRYEVE